MSLRKVSDFKPRLPEMSARIPSLQRVPDGSPSTPSTSMFDEAFRKTFGQRVFDSSGELIVDVGTDTPWNQIRGTIFPPNEKPPTCQECLRYVDSVKFYVRHSQGKRLLQREIHCHGAIQSQTMEYASPPGVYAALKAFYQRPAFAKPQVEKVEPKEKPEIEALREPRGTGL
jgi:hypothetical protein